MVQDYGVKRASAPAYDEGEKERIKVDVKKRIEEQRAQREQG